MTARSKKPILARENQEGRYIGDVCHVEECPCDDCAQAERADRERYADATGIALVREAIEDFDATRARFIAEWKNFDVTQRGLAQAFVVRFKGVLWTEEYRFDSRRGRWMEFKDEHWTQAHTILDEAGALVEALCGDSLSTKAKWGKVAVYKDVLALAKELLTIDQWDFFDSVLGLPNGEIWDLETGYGTQNYRRLPITKTTAVDPAEYQSRSICKGGCLWHRFLSDVTGGDADMEEHLQLSIGASLFGGNRDHRLNVVCGDGGTGKSLFLNTIGAALGDYAGAMPPSVLASKGNDHPTGLAGVVDKRFVMVPEVNAGMWKEETLKTITGGDAIPVRYMRQDFFVVKPDCTLWVSTNQPPSLSMVDDAIKRRMRIWPFTHKPVEVDTRLGEKLQERAMLGEVLQWALKGAEIYARLEGELPDCQAVKEATRDYFDDVDTIGGWLEACTTASQIPEHDTGAAACFKHYSAWCEKEGQKPTSRTAWGVSMGRRINNRHTKRGKVYAIELEGDGGDGLVTGSSPDPSPASTPMPPPKQGPF